MPAVKLEVIQLLIAGWHQPVLKFTDGPVARYFMLAEIRLDGTVVPAIKKERV